MPCTTVQRIIRCVYHIHCVYLPLLGVEKLFERSEFLIDTSQKKSLRVCTCARVPVCTCQIILVLVYVSRISSAPKIRICRYVCTRATSPPPKREQKALHRLRERQAHSATVIAQQGACNNYGQRYRGCTCCLMDTESLMIRRPFGSIDPNVCTRDTSPPQTKNTRSRTGSGSDTRTARRSLHSEVRVTTTASVTEGLAAVSWI